MGEEKKNPISGLLDKMNENMRRATSSCYINKFDVVLIGHARIKKGGLSAARGRRALGTATIHMERLCECVCGCGRFSQQAADRDCASLTCACNLLCYEPASSC